MKTAMVILLIFLGFVNLSLQQKAPKNFKLQGKITGVNTGLIVLDYWSDNKYKQDTVEIKDGQFIFKGNITEPTSADLITGSDLNNAGGITGKELNRATIFIEPGNMKILVKDKLKDLKMTGSKTQEELEELNLFEKSTRQKIDSVFAIITSIRESLSKNKGEAKLTERMENEYKKLASLHKERYALDLKFIRTHPKSFVSADLFFMIDKNEVVPLDSLKMIYSNLDISVQNGRNGSIIKKDIEKKDNNRIGATAPDFKAMDVNNQPVTISQFRGKNVVLMEFWASWCGPCRASFPHLKEVYKKYHSKGFEIITISKDFNKKEWKEAVKSEGIESWHPVPIAEKYAPDSIKKDDIYANYFFRMVPYSILIDKSGKIVGQWRGYSKENEEGLDKKLSELFLVN
jgi:peroxiredoxin